MWDASGRESYGVRAFDDKHEGAEAVNNSFRGKVSASIDPSIASAIHIDGNGSEPIRTAGSRSCGIKLSGGKCTFPVLIDNPGSHKVVMVEKQVRETIVIGRSCLTSHSELHMACCLSH